MNARNCKATKIQPDRCTESETALSAVRLGDLRDIARDAARRLAKLLPKDATITIEEPFMSADVMAILKEELPGVH